MVGVFGRSLSFPNKTNPNRAPTISHHIRSISLPTTRSHPLISQLKHELTMLKTWGSSTPQTRTTSWLCEGLNMLRDVHDSLNDLLHLPQSRESLRCHPGTVDKLLDDLLRFVDVFGIFRTSVLVLKEEQSASQVALRKRDGSKFISCMKSQKKLVDDMRNKLIPIVRLVEKFNVKDISEVSDMELYAAVADVIEVTSTVSLMLFNGIAISFYPRKPMWREKFRVLEEGKKKTKVDESIDEVRRSAEIAQSLRKVKEEDVKMVLKGMQELEDCVGEIESCSERVFRSLISVRVSLLNALTQ